MGPFPSGTKDEADSEGRWTPHSEGAPMSQTLAAGSPPSPCPGGEAMACRPCRGARSGRSEAGAPWRGGRLSSTSGWAAFRGAAAAATLTAEAIPVPAGEVL